MNTCPKCRETKNFHYNYDYSKAHRPVVDILCNNCGEKFPPVLKLPKEEPKQKRVPVLKLTSFDGIIFTSAATIEAPKQEPTLEEAAEKYVEDFDLSFYDTVEEIPVKELGKKDFKEGAKWQSERMYSEEDMKESFINGALTDLFNNWGISDENMAKEKFDEWFEQFKKTK
jgi:hypothetical protein